MTRRTTIIREVEDLYNPDPDAMIEVEITVSFSIAPPEPDVGIFRSWLEEWSVESTDSDLCDVDQAEHWLLSTKAGQRELQDMTDDAAEDDAWDRADYFWQERKDRRLGLED